MHFCYYREIIPFILWRHVWFLGTCLFNNSDDAIQTHACEKFFLFTRMTRGIWNERENSIHNFFCRDRKRKVTLLLFCYYYFHYYYYCIARGNFFCCAQKMKDILLTFHQYGSGKCTYNDDFKVCIIFSRWIYFYETKVQSTTPSSARGWLVLGENRKICWFAKRSNPACAFIRSPTINLYNRKSEIRKRVAGF